MRHVLLLIALFLFGAGCAAQNKTTAPDETIAVAGPEKIYANHCANCHGSNLQGSYGPSLEQVGNKYTQAEILTIIQKGKGTMPSQDYVAKEDQQKLAEWLAKQK